MFALTGLLASKHPVGVVREMDQTYVASNFGDYVILLTYATNKHLVDSIEDLSQPEIFNFRT
jgi:hypothetical protein